MPLTRHILVYRRWIAPLPVVGQLRNVGVPWLVGAMAAVYVGEFLFRGIMLNVFRSSIGI
ncbi:TPA: hypothetical protein ACP61A_004670 [Escherichia coli]